MKLIVMKIRHLKIDVVKIFGIGTRTIIIFTKLVVITLVSVE